MQSHSSEHNPLFTLQLNPVQMFTDIFTLNTQMSFGSWWLISPAYYHPYGVEGQKGNDFCVFWPDKFTDISNVQGF